MELWKGNTIGRLRHPTGWRFLKVSSRLAMIAMMNKIHSSCADALLASRMASVNKIAYHRRQRDGLPGRDGGFFRLVFRGVGSGRKRLVRRRKKGTNWCWYPPDYPLHELSFARVWVSPVWVSKSTTSESPSVGLAAVSGLQTITALFRRVTSANLVTRYSWASPKISVSTSLLPKAIGENSSITAPLEQNQVRSCWPSKVVLKLAWAPVRLTEDKLTLDKWHWKYRPQIDPRSRD